MDDPIVVERLEPIVMIWLAVVGACVGSFLNVAVFRLPRRCLSVFRPARSFCPLCRYQIQWYENLPIVSWAILLRGRCSNCKARIHWRYPLVEAVTCAIFAWLAVRELSGGRFTDPSAVGVFVVHATFASALLTCALIDIEFRIIPDAIAIPGILLSPLAVALLPDLLDAPPVRPLLDLRAGASWLYLTLESPFRWWGIDGLLDPLLSLARLASSSPEAYRHLAGFCGSIVGAAVGAGFIYLLGETFSRLLDLDEDKSAMGFGDVKYLAFIGALTGWQGVFLTVAVSCLAGSVFGILSMVWTGRTEIRGQDLADAETPIARFAMWVTGAQGPAAPDQIVRIRPGTKLMARFATGDPYVPFGPFLSLGAFCATFWPQLLPQLVRALGSS